MGTVAVLAAMVLTMPCARAQGAAMSPEKMFEQAMAAEDRGDMAAAEKLLVALEQRQPGNFAVEESLGLVYAQQSEFEKALRPLKKAAQLQPGSDAAHANLGAALYSLHENPEAAAELKKAVALNPANAGALRSLGRVEMELEQPEAAAKALGQALGLTPEDAELRMDCAEMLVAAKTPKAAVEVLQGWPQAGSTARAQVVLGEAEEALGDFKAAGDALTKAVALEPSEENAWRLGAELLKHWTFAASAEVFHAGAVRFPESRRMKTGEAAALFGAGKYEEAVPIFADLLDSDPENQGYAQLLGISCTVQEAGPKCAALERYAEGHPGDARAAVYAAQVLEGAGDAQNTLVEKLLMQAVKADPNLAEAQLEMGIYLQRQERFAEAAEYLKRAVELKADLAVAHYRLGLVFARLGRKEEARAEMEFEKKLAKQKQEELDKRLEQITTFVVDIK